VSTSTFLGPDFRGGGIDRSRAELVGFQAGSSREGAVIHPARLPRCDLGTTGPISGPISALESDLREPKIGPMVTQTGFSGTQNPESVTG